MRTHRNETLAAFLITHFLFTQLIPHFAQLFHSFGRGLLLLEIFTY